MTELSPAAQKTLRADAAVRCLAEWSSVNDPPCHPSDGGWSGCGTCVNLAAVAATLRAVVATCAYDDFGGHWIISPDDLEGIAAELESGQ